MFDMLANAHRRVIDAIGFWWVFLFYQILLLNIIFFHLMGYPFFFPMFFVECYSTHGWDGC